MLAEEKMFKYEMVNLPKIAIIGKEGLCTKEKNHKPAGKTSGIIKSVPKRSFWIL